MTANEQLLSTFYTAFQNRDFKKMQDCYADDAVFSDEVFVNLSATQVRAMWEMFCVSGNDVKIVFGSVQANENRGSAEWTATYNFSKTKRSVINHIKADFVFENGKIVQHHDHFNFHEWSSQALGMTGVLLGWTPFLRNKVQKSAMKSLMDFMEKRKK
ncbi:MAG: nuclear transport factor 2 family protein [Saprospiraceae bacterium]